uniref:Uncharacterized protein n=1 Tax=Biomphalaria glabrata TaxID=6526 RepID=A0A2C9LGT7_BIOGL
MSSLKSTSLSVMRPPKPPCWRDFVAPTAKSIASEGVDVTEARSPIVDLIDVSRSSASLPANKPSRLARRPRAKIHRTRSEHIIHAEELPESAFTGTLADTDPKGLRTRISEGCLYVEENNRRCQSWLASIEAAEPLDEVIYTNETPSSNKVAFHLFEDTESRKSDTNCDLKPLHHELIPIGELEQDEEVEIPEETFVWDISQENRQRSFSSDEDICCTCNLRVKSNIRASCKGQCALYESVHRSTPSSSPDPNHKQNFDSAESPKDIASSRELLSRLTHQRVFLPGNDHNSSKSQAGGSDTLTLTLEPVGPTDDSTKTMVNPKPSKVSSLQRNPADSKQVDKSSLPH